MKSVLFCFGVSCLMTLAKTSEFSYDKETEDWSKDFGTCKGKHQSPIDINILNVKKVDLRPLEIVNFDKIPQAIEIENNGHTAYVTVVHDNIENMPIIRGGPLYGDYKFVQLHYHWSHNDSFGSEDSINGKHYAMELHIVFYKDKYGSMDNATKYPDGLAVMAFFFKIADHSNEAYKELSATLELIEKPHTKTQLENPHPLMNYVQNDFDDYYVYNGSLTTPPCLEVVTWLDFFHPIPITHEELQKFRQLQNSEGKSLNHNFRPVQQIGDRIVWYASQSFEDDDEDVHNEIHGKPGRARKSSAGKTEFSLSLLVLAIVIKIFQMN